MPKTLLFLVRGMSIKKLSIYRIFIIMRVSLCVCVFVLPFFFIDYHQFVHPSTKRLERVGKKRKVVERDREGIQDLASTTSYVGSHDRYGRMYSALQFFSYCLADSSSIDCHQVRRQVCRVTESIEILLSSTILQLSYEHDKQLSRYSCVLDSNLY